ncbi:hypothetical protein [Pelagicoccus albus]|uniref:Outer membrane lipoprotein-sorting protein n=1 Tax=Pelagicoccus albus TaxID=415222 RepID=A0A7X1B827_9BACT|nr:hypothetical protein [Pelagicoccus albus]MBC2607375.1 hypothetical protein [Pelagicoccus albus]
MIASCLNRTFIYVLVALAPLAASARAALPDSVIEVLEANLEASGGREALEAIKSSRLKGTLAIEAMNMTGSSMVVQAYPDKIYSEQVLPGLGTMTQGYDGEIGWANDPMQGFRYLGEAEIAALKQNESFSDILDFESSFSSGELLPDEEVRGEPAAVLKLVSAATELPETRYYSKESWLLLRVDTIAVSPMGEIKAVMDFLEYGNQDGIVYPTRMELNNMGVIIVITFDSLELNPAIDESIFSAPQ